jgi:hypothetical protein
VPDGIEHRPMRQKRHLAMARIESRPSFSLPEGTGASNFNHPVDRLAVSQEGLGKCGYKVKYGASYYPLKEQVSSGRSPPRSIGANTRCPPSARATGSSESQCYQPADKLFDRMDQTDTVSK